MRVTVFCCGPAANESELIASKHLETRLQSSSGDDEWILLTNLAFSVTQHLQSDEIDIVAIGPAGIRIIEVKHWTAQWVDGNSEIVTHEAERVTEKARKVGTTLRKVVPQLPHVSGALLLTQESSKIKRLAGREVRGIGFYSLSEWKDAIGFDSPARLSAQQVRALGRALEPKSAVALDGSLRRFAGYVNLELKTPKEDRFHRIYKGTHPTRQDKVVLHLYDLSVRDEANAEAKARREYEALQRLQLHTWAPRILDSFQTAPGYPGEMYFFTVVDPAAPSIQERGCDGSWDTTARVAFARSTICALKELHEAGAGHEPMLHRNLTAKTILVRYDNSPILTGFDRTKIPSDITVASAGAVSPDWEETAAPELRSLGIAAADQRSDVYSLCASLTRLFDGKSDATCKQAATVLARGTVQDPQTRATLSQIELRFAELLGESVPKPAAPPARFWTEDQLIEFHDRQYRIVSRLGSGGVGTTFKVIEIDRLTQEDLGTYVAKIGHHIESGTRVLRAYSMARPYLGRHAALSAVFEVAREWRDNSFTALMTWIEGVPLREFMGVFPLLAEEQQEHSPEALGVRWLHSMCEALSVLHRNGLVHGDVSPRNMIVSGSDLVLTDYDFVTRVGEPFRGPATVLYCAPQEANGLASPRDDFYALAASFFHVIFEREPFQYGGTVAKERGLNWEGVDRNAWAVLAPFLDKATHPDREQRFSSAAQALAGLQPRQIGEGQTSTSRNLIANTETGNGGGALQTEERLEEQEITWLLSLLQSYPGSRWGNRETRGLDTDFAAETYVETDFEAMLHRDILDRRVRLVILCGNAGDGKTALLQHLATKLGFGKHSSSERILEGRMPDGLAVRMNLDGSAAWQGRSADDLLNEFLEPFQQGPPTQDIAHLLAINDGRLLEWIETGSETPLTQELYEMVQGDSTAENSHIRFINLNERSLVGGVTQCRRDVETTFLNRLLEELYGNERASAIWESCKSCRAKNRCEVFRASRIFGPGTLSGAAPEPVRMRARKRLFEALQAVHLRGETHVTVRELRAALVYVLFGVHFCRDYHDHTEIKPIPYWDRAFSPESPYRQGEVLREIARFDPALEAHPQIDRYLLSEPSSDSGKTAPHYGNIGLESARRRAFFEWTEDQVEEVAGDRNALGLARGQNLSLFRSLALDSDPEKHAALCGRLCRGISRLEDLPPQAFDRPGVVPLRITPRTPTETIFWVEKPLSAFRLEADIPSTPGIDRLHRQAFLIYRYRAGAEEQLRLGAELFHLLLELSDGYQLGDVSTDDTFAHLSIFVQRLIREDERELLAWTPMKDDLLYKVSARIDRTREPIRQRMVLSPLFSGEE